MSPRYNILERRAKLLIILPMHKTMFSVQRSHPDFRLGVLEKVAWTLYKKDAKNWLSNENSKNSKVVCLYDFSMGLLPKTSSNYASICMDWNSEITAGGHLFSLKHTWIPSLKPNEIREPFCRQIWSAIQCWVWRESIVKIVWLGKYCMFLCQSVIYPFTDCFLCNPWRV